MTRKEWRETKRSERPNPENFLTGGCEPMSTEEVMAKIKRAIKLAGIDRSTTDVMERYSVGVKPIPFEKLINLKLIKQFIYTDTAYQNYIETIKTIQYEYNFEPTENARIHESEKYNPFMQESSSMGNSFQMPSEL